MAKIVFAWLKANWFRIGAWLFRGVDWAGLMARAFSYLLRLAVNHGSYAQVRLVAERVVEQAQHVLSVTDDGVIDADEAASGIAAVRRLLDAWAEGRGKSITRPIEAQIKQAVEVSHGQVGQVGQTGQARKTGQGQQSHQGQ